MMGFAGPPGDDLVQVLDLDLGELLVAEAVQDEHRWFDEFAQPAFPLAFLLAPVVEVAQDGKVEVKRTS